MFRITTKLLYRLCDFSSCLAKFNFGQPLFNPAELVSKLCSPLTRLEVFEPIEGLPSIQEYQISPAHHTADQYFDESQTLLAASLPLPLKFEETPSAPLM